MRLLLTIVLAAALRAGLIAYGNYHDAQSSLKYTDVDYAVVSDAAALLLPGSNGSLRADGPLARRYGLDLGSPYDRATYRYTPLLALVAVPNHTLFPEWGKAVFALADILIGVLLYQTLIRRGQSERSAAAWVGGVWLLNPMVANISTRGSSEALLGLLVVGFVAAAEAGRWATAATLLGLATHWKIFPFIYGAAAWARYRAGPRRWSVGARQAGFAVLSLFVFTALGGAMYAIWGDAFIEHTYLYHVHRRDHRHNFSPYFYPTYLTYPSTPPRSSAGPSLVHIVIRHPLTSFLPQFGLSLGLGFLWGGHDLPFACLLQTLAFVSLNKVATSQYFMWYLWLLPLVLPRLHVSVVRGATMLIAWIAAQALWLSQAYRLELIGEPVFLEVWASSIAFLVVDAWLLLQLIDAYPTTLVHTPHAPSADRKREMQ